MGACTSTESKLPTAIRRRTDLQALKAPDQGGVGEKKGAGFLTASTKGWLISSPRLPLLLGAALGVDRLEMVFNGTRRSRG